MYIDWILTENKRKVKKWEPTTRQQLVYIEWRKKARWGEGEEDNRYYLYCKEQDYNGNYYGNSWACMGSFITLDQAKFEAEELIKRISDTIFFR